jgi:(Z)-2-((N-methylformamido)methylene)-5-hydroxybutyrolactone dehydrogenase
MAAGKLEHYELFINGRSIEAASAETFRSINPASGQPWAEVASGGPADVDRAVAAAADAASPWAALPGYERGGLLRRLGDLIRDHAEELAQLETRDNGKAIRQTRGELAIIPQWYWYYGGASDKLEGSYIPITPDLEAQVRFEPIGTVGAITPFNSPLMLAAWKLGPALAAGNTVVLKPAPETPVTSLRLAELAMEAGFPAGVINVVPGGDDAGRALVAHPAVGKVAFTGESATAREIAVSAAATLKRVSLEGGGKSAHIIFADADLEQALVAAAAGVFISAGQTCVAGSRLLLERSIFDAFTERLAAKADSLRLGDPTDPKTHVGAVTSERQFRKIQSYVDIARQEGATVLAGGTAASGALSDGYFYRPTVLIDVRNEMRVCQEEIFGPVVACMPFADEEEAVALANAVPYGLAGGIWTNDIRRAHRLSHVLQVGTVWVNNYRTIHWQAPFGGRKQSGYGRENGLEALRDYMTVKTVMTDFGQITDPFGD